MMNNKVNSKLDHNDILDLINIYIGSSNFSNDIFIITSNINYKYHIYTGRYRDNNNYSYISYYTNNIQNKISNSIMKLSEKLFNYICKYHTDYNINKIHKYIKI